MGMQGKDWDQDAGYEAKCNLTYNNAVVSGMPYIRLKFCTAAPEAPLIRLSMTLMHHDPAADDAGRDVAEIGAGDVLGAGQAVDHADERLVGVELAEDR